jgi:hypothetical protein
VGLLGVDVVVLCAMLVVVIAVAVQFSGVLAEGEHSAQEKYLAAVLRRGGVAHTGLLRHRRTQRQRVASTMGLCETSVCKDWFLVVHRGQCFFVRT